MPSPDPSAAPPDALAGWLAAARAGDAAARDRLFKDRTVNGTSASDSMVPVGR